MTVGLAAIVRDIANSSGFRFDASLFAAATLVGLGALVVMLPGRRALFAGAALIVAWLAAYVLYARLPDLLGGPVPVGDAVGAAAFYRSPYVGAQLTALALIVLTGAVAAALSRRATAPAAGAAGAVPPDGAATPTPRPARRAHRLVALAAALVAVTLVPDLHDQLIVQSRGPLDVTEWDNGNLFAWDFFLQQGFTPMVDFWFPYGNAWIFDEFPEGPIAMFLWQAFLLALAAWALARLIGPQPWRIAFCLLAIVALGLFDLPGTFLPQTFWRYIPGFVLALAYAAAGPLARGTPARAHAVLLVACAAVATLAFDVFMLALGGMLFVAIGEIATNPAVRGRRLVRAAAVDLLPIAGGAICMLATWVAMGTFAANVRWYGDVSGVSAYSASDQDVFGSLMGLDQAPSLVLVVAAIPALLLVLAFAYGRLAHRTERAVAAMLFAAAGVSSVMLAKHMVRPQGSLVLIAPLLALGMSAVVLWKARSVRSWVAVALFAGALGSVLHDAAKVTLTTYAGNVVEVPVTIVRDIAQIADRDELREAAAGRFAAARFAAAAEKRLIGDPLRGALSGTGDARFAMLGDAQLLYVIFRQLPPVHTQMYNMAPKAEQREVIAALKRMAPARLVWRRDLDIDRVPYPVRVPLVFAHAIQHYVPERRGDPWDVLRPRKRGEPPALGFWRARLGDTRRPRRHPQLLARRGRGAVRRSIELRAVRRHHRQAREGWREARHRRARRAAAVQDHLDRLRGRRALLGSPRSALVLAVRRDRGEAEQRHARLAGAPRRRPRGRRPVLSGPVRKFCAELSEPAHADAVQARPAKHADIAAELVAQAELRLLVQRRAAWGARHAADLPAREQDLERDLRADRHRARGEPEREHERAVEAAEAVGRVGDVLAEDRADRAPVDALVGAKARRHRVGAGLVLEA